MYQFRVAYCKSPPAAPFILLAATRSETAQKLLTGFIDKSYYVIHCHISWHDRRNDFSGVV
jgi:hypothetical protein